jgi:hypothetical protein
VVVIVVIIVIIIVIVIIIIINKQLKRNGFSCSYRYNPLFNIIVK